MIFQRGSKPTANKYILKAYIYKHQNEIARCILLTISVINIFQNVFIRFALSFTVDFIEISKKIVLWFLEIHVIPIFIFFYPIRPTLFCNRFFFFLNQLTAFYSRTILGGSDRLKCFRKIFCVIQKFNNASPNCRIYSFLDRSTTNDNKNTTYFHIFPNRENITIEHVIGCTKNMVIDWDIGYCIYPMKN